MPDPVSPEDFGSLLGGSSTAVAPEDFGNLMAPPAPEAFGELLDQGARDQGFIAQTAAKATDPFAEEKARLRAGPAPKSMVAPPQDVGEPSPPVAGELTDAGITPEALAAQKSGHRERERLANIEARKAVYKDDPKFAETGYGSDEIREMNRRRDASIVEQAKADPASYGFGVKPLGQIIRAAGMPITTPGEVLGELHKRRQPGGDLFDPSNAKLADAMLASGAHVATGSVLPLMMPGATMGLAAAAPVVEPVMEAISPGAAITEATGSELAGAVSDLAVQGAVLHQAGKFGGKALNRAMPERLILPDARALAAIDAARRSTPSEPSLAGAPNAENARLVVRRQPFVRNQEPPRQALPVPEKPEVAGGAQVPDPTTDLARVAPGAPGTLVTPPPVIAGRDASGALVPEVPRPETPVRGLPAAPAPRALVENVPMPGVMQGSTQDSAGAPPVKPVTGKAKFGGKPTPTTTDAQGGPLPEAAPTAPPTTPIRSVEGVDVANLGGRGAKATETVPGPAPRRFGRRGTEPAATAPRMPPESVAPPSRDIGPTPREGPPALPEPFAPQRPPAPPAPRALPAKTEMVRLADGREIPLTDRLSPALDRLESSRLKKEMNEQGYDVTIAEGGGVEKRTPPRQAEPAQAPAPSEKAPTVSDESGYSEFAKQYRATFDKLMSYKPTEIGSEVYAEKLAKLADAHPDWAERVESERPAEVPPPASSEVAKPEIQPRETGAGKSPTVPEDAGEHPTGTQPAPTEAPFEPAAPKRFGAKRPAATGEPGSEGVWPVDQMEIDPKAMQFKPMLDEKTGETGALKDIKGPQDWKRSSEGVVTLWREPETGRVLVADGHQRVAAAKRAGVKVLLSRFSEAKTTGEARVEGALTNLDNGSLTAHDAANLFRELRLKGNDLRAYMREKKIKPSAASRSGQALANLSPDVWDEYLAGRLPEDKAVAIGREELDPAQQRRIVKADVPAEEVPTLANRVRNAPVVTKMAQGLFGTETEMSSLDLPVNQIENAVLRALKKEKGLYRSAATNKAALESVGHIEGDKATAAADEAGTLHGAVKALFGKTGPVNDAVMRAAADVEAGRMKVPEAAKALRASLAEVVRKSNPELSDALGKSAPEPEPGVADTLMGGLFGGEKPAEAPKPEPTKPPRFGGKGETGAAGDLPRGGGLPSVGEAAKAVEGWIEPVEEKYKGVVKRFGAKLKEKFPKTAEVLDKAHTAVLRSPERKISQGLEDVVMEGRSVTRGLERGAKRAVVEFEKAAKSLTAAQKEQVGESLSSRPADLSSLSEPQRAAVERLRGRVQEMRAREVRAGTLSEEAFNEYMDGHLKRVLKPGNVVERMFGRRGGAAVKAYKTADDMFAVELEMPEAEARRIAEDLSPRYVKQDGRRTLLKFSDSAEGSAARDEFVSRVKQKLATQRSLRGGSASSWIRQGEVRHAKRTMAEALEVPTMSEIGVEVRDPIPADVAKRIFIEDPATRAHVTLQESARRIGKAETLQKIADLVDEKGPVAIEPENVAAAAAGRETPPKGYEFVANKDYRQLSGKFVRSDVAEYVRGAYGAESRGAVRGAFDGIMERFKVSRLLYNPRQWVRQVPSNMEYENLMGFSNWSPRYLAHKIRGLAAMREGSKYRAGLEAEGFLDPAYVSNAELGIAEGELTNTSYDVGKRIGRAIGSFGLTEAAPEGLRKTEAALGRAYAAADSWTKASGYVFAIEELGMTPKQAAAYVRKWTPSPESVSEMVQGYSKTILGDPWARYKAEQIRIGGQALAEKPIRYAMNWNQRNIIRAALVAGGASLLSADEEEALENEQGSGAVAIMRNDKGEPLAIDYSFLSTLTDLFDTPEEVGKHGEHLWDRFLQVSGWGDNPVYSTAVQAISGKNQRTGREINPEGTTAGAVASRAKLFLNQWVPSLATNHFDKLRAAWKGEPYSRNQPPQTKSQAVLDVFFGFKLAPLDADRALTRIALQGDRAIDDLTAEFTAKKAMGEPVDKERTKAMARAIAEDYKARRKPLRGAREDAKRFGAKPEAVK